MLVVYFQINLKGLRLNILSHLFDSLDHGNFFFSKSINGDVASLKQVLFLFLGARAWPPGFLQGGSGHPCFHTKGHGSTLPRRRRHQAAVPAPPANSKHRTSSPVHRLCIEHLDRKQHLAAILLVSLYAVGQDQQ